LVLDPFLFPIINCSLQKEVNEMKSRNAGICLLISILLALAPIARAQQTAAKIEPEEMYQRYLNLALNGAVPTVIKGGIIMPANWMADGSSFWYAEGAPENTVIFKVDPRANSKKPLFDTKRLKHSLAKFLGHELPYQGLPFERFSFIDAERSIKFTAEGKDLILDLKTYALKAVPQPTDEEKKKVERFVPKTFKFLLGGDATELLSPDSQWFAGVEDNNLYLRSTATDQIETLTTDGTKDQSWEIWNASPEWSPDSSKLAITKVDIRNMPRMPLVRWLKTPVELEWVPYARAGEPLWRSELYVIEVKTKKQTKIDTGDLTDRFIMIVGWMPDSSEFLFYTVDREFKKLDLMAVNAATGATRAMLTETQKTFLNFAAFEKPDVPILEGGKKFLWKSERDGWNHVYLYGSEGKLIRQLTSGAFVVNEIKAVDEKRGWVYFMAQVNPDRPYDQHLCRVNLMGKDFSRLTEADGEHLIQVSPSKECFLDINGNLSRPPVTDLRKMDGRWLQTVSKANIDILKEQFQWSPPEGFKVKAADGQTDIYGVLFKPYNFDPGKKYPVVEYIYNGPHSSDVPGNMFTALMDPEWAIAQLGFITMVVNGRGTIGRGKEFQDAFYGKLGQGEIQDHVAVLKQLAEKRPYIDLNRVGIHGISWGGYLTLRAMLLAPDVYKVGVATAPLADLADCMAYTEHYMGLPKNNKKGYEEGSCLPIAKNLEGKLLIIHGNQDRSAPFSETVKMVDALMRAGKPVDNLILPEQPHVPEGDGYKYWVKVRHAYLKEHLLGVNEFPEQKKKPVIDGKIVPYIGDYDFQGYTVPVTSKDGKTLTMIVPGQPEHELVLDQGSRFTIKNAPGFSVEFLMDQAGQVTGLKLIQPSGEFFELKIK